MKVEVKNGYCTGNYAVIGGGIDWIEVEELPTDDTLKIRCYKPLKNDDGITLEFDEEKYNTLLKEQQTEKLAVLKLQKIEKSKQNLQEYLEKTKLVSSVHGGIEKNYSITSEKQQYLASMILTSQMSLASGVKYQPSWNASGEECTYDWTLEELTQLAFEIEAMVRPLISQQQTMEVAINNAITIDELNAIDITFGGEKNNGEFL